MKSVIISLFIFLSVHIINCDSKSTIRWNRTNFPGLYSNITQFPVQWTFNLKDIPHNADHNGKLCLNNLDKCLEEDQNNYESIAQYFSQLALSAAPPLDLTLDGISPKCRAQSRKFRNALEQLKLWALKMYDSSAKLPSGILNGNVNQLGDFDMCLQVSESRIQGQYCLASMQFETKNIGSAYVSALHRLMQSHYHFKSELNDPGHRVPRFSSVNWALCVPDGCSPKDVELGLKKSLEGISEKTGLEVGVLVEDHMCQTGGKNHYSKATMITMYIFSGVILLVLAAGLYDFYLEGCPKNEWIMAFSLRKNLTSLASLKRAHDDIQAIHGIRFLNAFLLVCSHKSMAVFYTPYANRTEMIEYFARPWTVIGRAASLYTDPFIMISGTLTAYSLLGKLQKGQRLNIPQEYALRLLRIVPTFAALIAFCTFILPYLNSGPMWNLVVTHHSDICKKYWWRNLLFIHNYFGFKDMCLTHTHHVGIDTQLFFASPFLLLVLYKWPRKGALGLIALALASTMMRYHVTYTMGLSNYVHFGTSIKQLFATADNMYTLPVHRATVYIMGILLGFLLRNYQNYSPSKLLLRMGNTVAFLSVCFGLLGAAFMGDLSYVYNARDAAWYAAFAPILWCFAFAWIIYTAQIGQNGPIQRIFSHRYFLPWTKLSYAVYLTQFPIFFYNVGITRTPEQFDFLRHMFNYNEIISILLSSIALTVLFEMPVQNVKNIIFSKHGRIASTEVKKIS